MKTHAVLPLDLHSRTIYFAARPLLGRLLLLWPLGSPPRAPRSLRNGSASSFFRSYRRSCGQRGARDTQPSRDHAGGCARRRPAGENIAR